MDPSEDGVMNASPSSNPTRRRVLSAGAGLAATSAVVTTATATPATPIATPTVLTWNLYVGVDLSRLFDAESMADVRAIAADFLADAEPTVYERRAEAIADGIAAAEADVVAVQEALKLRTQQPGDYGDESSEPASTVVVDMLDLLTSKLSDRGLEYEVATAAVTTDAELPADTDDGQVDVRITDRDALLVREGVETLDTETDIYTASVSVSMPDSDRAIGLGRGYCRAELRLNGVDFTVVSTHLESISSLFRQLQARELLARLPGDQAEILCGDFNSGPGTSSDTYEYLTDSFDDAYATRHPDRDGFTCCQASNLRNAKSRLDRRIDAVLYRGDVRPTASERVGESPNDRVTVNAGSESRQLWPSDHAGVVSTFELGEATPTPTPTVTPTSTPIRTPTATPSRTPPQSTTATGGGDEQPDDSMTSTASGSGPGLTVIGTLAGLVGGVLAWLRR